MSKVKVLDLLNPAKPTPAELFAALKERLEEVEQAEKLRDADVTAQQRRILTEYRSITTELLKYTQRFQTESTSTIKGLKETISAQMGDISHITRVLDALLLQREAEQAASQEFVDIITRWLDKH